MKKLLFGIFAHPDDEAFGPSATLLKEVSEGTELHLICATLGENGVNPDGVPDLAALRHQEWQAAGKALGATSMHMLGQNDGYLANHLYHQIATQIEAIIAECVASRKGVYISFMTFDPNGLTGHLDHIAMSYITTYVFYRLKALPAEGATIGELAYFCLPHTYFPTSDTSFVFMPQGRDDTFINQKVDVRMYIQKKYDIMALHHSQRKDAAFWRSFNDDFHATDHFKVLS